MRRKFAISMFSFGVVLVLILSAKSQLPIGPQGDTVVYSLEQGKVRLGNGPPTVLTPRGTVIEVAVDDFSPYKAEQESTEWCWAACLQMLINHRGVSISQNDVVSQIKGKVVYETASPDEINKYLNARYNVKGGTGTWTANTLYIPNKIDPNVMLRMLGSTDRPLLVSLKQEDEDNTQHLVAVIKTSFKAGIGVDTITIYDPYDGKEKTLSWAEAKRRVTASFAAMVVSDNRDPRTFTNPAYLP